MVHCPDDDATRLRSHTQSIRPATEDSRLFESSVGSHTLDTHPMLAQSGKHGDFAKVLQRVSASPGRGCQLYRWGNIWLIMTSSADRLSLTSFVLIRGRPAMFVANHNSWMDIPYLGSTIGWRNYKIIAKKELSKVPALGKAIYLGGHVMVDRTDRKSQLKTLKTGIQYLKDGVHLCTFPEGTRSRTGKVLPFKNGAFKMAYKAGAPIIPLSIVGANKMMPAHWMFPFRSGHGITKVIVHDPIECKGKTEAELAAEVRKVMLSGLPLDQRSDNE